MGLSYLWRAMYSCGGLCIAVEGMNSCVGLCIGVEGYV